jgi:DNA-binding NarL/FixJ family response regulator
VKTVRILLVDDHEVVRKGLRELLKGHKHWKVVGEAANGREAVGKVKRLKPDVVVMDYGMPELNGLEATRQIVEAVPGTELLILTPHDSEELAREIVGAGARGYVLKSDTGRNIVKAVNALRQHKPFFSAEAAQMLLKDNVQDVKLIVTRHASRHTLTPREREIVQFVGEGRSNKEVAAALGISVRTAETHRYNAMRKLELHAISDLVRYAIRNRLIEA